MIQIFDCLDSAPASVWLAVFCALAVLAVLAGWVWFGWRVVLLSAALIGGGLLVGLAVALAVDGLLWLLVAHTSLVVGFALGFALGFGLGCALVFVAWLLWGVCAIGKTADPGNRNN